MTLNPTAPWPFATRTHQEPAVPAIRPVLSPYYAPTKKEVGIFPGSVKPVHHGMYKRISPAGNVVWSHWNGRFWGMFGSKKGRALERAHKASKKQSLPWIASAIEPKK